MSARIVSAIIVCGVALALATGCSGSSGGAAPATTRAAATTDPVATTTLTTAAPTTKPATTAPPSGPTMFFPDRTAAIDHLVNAWKYGDRSGAAEGADLTAVSNLFTQPANGFSLYGCDEGGFDTSTCNYRNRATSGYAQITAEKQAKGWIVTVVVMSTDG